MTARASQLGGPSPGGRVRAMIAAAGAVGVVAAIAVAAVVVRHTHIGELSPSAPGSASSAMTTGTSTTASAVVPWVDRPAPSEPPASPPSTPTPAPAYPPCTAAQLKATSGGGGAAAGNDISVVVLTNASSTDCSLSGYPTSLALMDPRGVRHAVIPTHGTMFDDGYRWPSDLHPGDAGKVGVTDSGACDAAQQSHAPPPSYTAVVLGLPDGGTISAPAVVSPVCGLGITPFGQPPPPALDASPALIVTLNAPDAVPRGSTLHYTVRLTNKTDQAVALEPCPTYEQNIYPATSQAVQSDFFKLNCDTVHAIAAHRSVTYAMRMHVPGVPETTIAKLGWSIPARLDAAAGTAITITAGAAAPAASSTGTLTGRALLYGGPLKPDGKQALDGTPGGGIVVIVTDAAGNAVTKTVSGSDGEFSFELPPGTYTLRGCVVTSATLTAGAKTTKDLTCPVP